MVFIFHYYICCIHCFIIQHIIFSILLGLYFVLTGQSYRLDLGMYVRVVLSKCYISIFKFNALYFIITRFLLETSPYMWAFMGIAIGLTLSILGAGWYAVQILQYSLTDISYHSFCLLIFVLKKYFNDRISLYI